MADFGRDESYRSASLGGRCLSTARLGGYSRSHGCMICRGAVAFGWALIFAVTFIPQSFGQLTITNVGTGNPNTNVFLSQTVSDTWSPISEGSSTVDAGGVGQTFLVPDTGDASGGWNVSVVTLGLHSTSPEPEFLADSTMRFSIYRWHNRSNPEVIGSLEGGQLQGDLIFQGTANFPKDPLVGGTRYSMNLATPVFLQENIAYGFVFEFDPATGNKNGLDALRFETGRDGAGGTFGDPDIVGEKFLPGRRWNVSYDNSMGEYSSSVFNPADDLVFFMQGTKSATIGDVPKLIINRDTGNITLSSPQSHAITSYSIATEQGAFNPAQRVSFADNSVAGWSETANSAAEFAESGPSLNLNTVSPANFGNSWRKSPFEDMEFVTSLSALVGVVEFTGNGGNPYELADFNTDGDVTAADWAVLRSNLLRDTSALDNYGRWASGDMNRDGMVDEIDFRAFKGDFIAAHGLKAFNAMLAGVPEPSSALLVAVAAGFFLPSRWSKSRLRSLRRAVPVFTVFLFSLTALPASAQFTFSTSPTAPTGPFAVNSPAAREGNDLIGTDGTGVRAVRGTTFTLSPTGNPSTPVWEIDKITIGQFSTQGANLAGKNFTLEIYNWPGGDAETLVSRPTDNGGAPVFTATQPWASTETGITYVTFDLANNPLLKPGAYVFNMGFDSSLPNAHGLRWARTAPAQSEDTTPGAAKWVELPVSGNALQLNQDYVFFIEGSAVPVSGPEFLTLRVNKNTGIASLLGATGGDVAIDFYKIESASGALDPSWAGLEGLGFDDNGIPGDGIGWERAGQADAYRIAEAFLDGSSTIASDDELLLGKLYDGPGSVEDLLFSYTVDGVSTIGAIEYVTGTDGDFNLDGYVDGADFLMWQRGQSPTSLSATDLADWESNFGAGAPSAVASTAVPEPGAATMLLVLSAAVGASRWLHTRLAAKA